MQPRGLGLAGRRALITGGSKGIGRAIAVALAAEGVDVAICARNREAIEEAAAELTEHGGRVFADVADVTDEPQAAEFVERAAASLGGIDILVNNAGGAIPGDFFTLTNDEWRADIDVKLFSMIHCIRASYPYLRTSVAGRIINIGAVFAHRPDPSFMAATTLRAAGANMSQALARQLAPDGILVNTVHIGFVETPQWERIWQRRAPEMSWPAFLADLAEREIPLRRFGRPAEVADLVAFLASDKASYITGNAIDVAGGMAL